MHFGLNMECDYVQGKTEQDAFHDMFAQVDLAEDVGLDSVWIAERHFSSNDAGQPSIASSPIVLSTAIAARTKRLRVITGVYVLPLNHNVCVTPKPLQKPHPPIYMAATTSESFPIAGRNGRHLVVGVRRTSVGQVKESVQLYRRAWQEAGHPGSGDVTLRLPVFVATTREEAEAVPEASTLKYYRRLADSLTQSVNRAGTAADEDRARLAQELSNVTYDRLLRDWVVYGTPDVVAERLQRIIEAIDLSGVVMEMNAGGLVPIGHILQSLRLFGEAVAPKLR